MDTMNEENTTTDETPADQPTKTASAESAGQPVNAQKSPPEYSINFAKIEATFQTHRTGQTPTVSWKQFTDATDPMPRHELQRRLWNALLHTALPSTTPAARVDARKPTRRRRLNSPRQIAAQIAATIHALQEGTADPARSRATLYALQVLLTATKMHKSDPKPRPKASNPPAPRIPGQP